MSDRGSRRLAWGLAALASVLLIASIAVELTAGVGLDASSEAILWAIALVFAAVGRLIASREPGNAIGWLFLGAAVAAGVGTLSSSYAGAWTHDPFGPALLGRTAAWYGSLSWIPWILVPSTFLLLLFPDGHLVSPRWRRVAWCAAAGMAGGFVTQGLAPGGLEDYPHVTNPYGVHTPVLDPLTGLSVLLIVVGVVGSSASLIVRFRRSRGELRQQIKWLALAGAVAAVTLFVSIAVYDVVGAGVANAAIMFGVLGLPLAAGIAILRYRLYDVDVVINRALVYGALTATLAGCYLGAVLLLQLVLSGATQGSGLAVAGSTLAVAALFRPARGRIQEAVDRRFYRRKYDAQRTLDAFSARLRGEVTLEALSSELRAVVGDTMAPAHVSLWLRTPEGTA
jgi:MFS family permease